MVSDVVVVGGGIVGCASAYELAHRGVAVTLCEAAGLAAGASGRNHGLVLSPLDPFLLPMARGTVALYEAIAEGAPMPFGLDPDPIGFMILAGPSETERAAGRAEADAASACGVEVDHLAEDAIHSVEPNVAPDLAEGWLLEDGRRVDPAALTVSLGLLAREHGADVRTNTAVRGLISDGDRVRGVITDQGRIETDVVVMAAGPWSGGLLRPLGIELPVTGSRGWLVHLAPADPPIARLVGRAGWHTPPAAERTPPTTAVDLADADGRTELGTLLQPNRDGTILVGGSRQPVITQEPEDPLVPRRLVAEATRLVPSLADGRVLGSWWGIRPVTPDGRPIVARIGDGLVVATGHGSLGVILGGGTGQLVASLVTDVNPPFDPAPFRGEGFLV